MLTVMYDDVADDVKKKGYVAISHVWGNQTSYSAESLRISGISWDVPLSSFGKIFRLINAMTSFGKEYCWFDVLCMPQGKDRQWEVNLEIPFMGDYSGAKTSMDDIC